MAIQKVKEAEEEVGDNEMVFGELTDEYVEKEVEVDCDGFELVVDTDSDDDASHPLASTSASVDPSADVVRREHKRLKHWGKKNKKLRDKNPYGEENGVVSYAVYSTNRNVVKVLLSQ